MATNEQSREYKLKLEIPFETPRQAEIAAKSLSPDPILRPNEITINYKPQDCKLIIDLQAVSDRVLRVATNSLMDNIKVVIECIDELDVGVIDQGV